MIDPQTFAYIAWTTAYITAYGDMHGSVQSVAKGAADFYDVMRAESDRRYPPPKIDNSAEQDSAQKTEPA